MANRNLTLKSTLGLETKGFKKGVTMAQSALNSLKMKFMGLSAAIAGGVGFSNLGKTLVDTAKLMDKSQTTLKNVSNSYKEYAESQKFLIQLSDKYNQDILVLTDNFSKFHASSDQANVSLQDQQKIFESLTRASAFYNLTADETNGVFLAITQMMSKGKVASEELRRQLGERLPGAFGLMANALGMTTQQLDKALKDGKVMAADALPKLADALNGVTQNLDVDTIQGWSNRLKNAVTGLVKKLNIQDMYKNIVKFGAKSTEWLTKNFKNVATVISSVLAGALGGTVWNKGKSAYQRYFKDLEAEKEYHLKKAQQQLDALQKKGLYKNASITDGPLFSQKESYESFKERSMRLHGDMNEWGSREMYRIYSKNFDERNKLLAKYNDELKQANELEEVLNNKTNKTKRIWADIKTYIGSAFKSMISGAVVAGITWITTKLVQMANEAKKVRNYLKDMNAEYDKYVDKASPEEAQLKFMQTQLAEMTKKEKEDPFEYAASFKERQKLIAQANALLGLQGDKELKIEDTNEKINKLIQDRLDLINKQQKQEIAIQQITDATNAMNELEKQSEEVKKKLDSAKKEYNELLKNPFTTSETLSSYIFEISNLERKYKNLQKQIKDNGIIISSRGKDLLDLGLDMKNTKDEMTEAEITYESLKDTYEDNVETLQLKLKDGAITQEEYNNSLENLISATLDEIYALAKTSDKIKVGADDFSKGLLTQLNYLKGLKVKQVVKDDDLKGFKKALENFSTASKEITNKLEAGAIDSEGFDKAMKALVDETFDTLAEMGYLSGELSAFAEVIKTLHTQFAEKEKNKELDAFKKGMPKLEERDSKFDYSKSDSEIKYEQAEIWQNQADKLQAKLDEIADNSDLEGMFDEVNKQLTEAIKNAKTFKDAADLSKIKEDVGDLRKSAFSSISDGVGSVATIIDRITDDVEKLSNPEIEGWERIQVILNSIFQTFDGIIKAVEMFTELEKIINQLTAAEKAQQAVEAAGTATSLAGSASKVAAGQAEALSNGTASAAKLPWPANLAAIAASIAAITAIFATFPKFANGGLVGGHSMTGDKLLARVNSGEMILNQKQQSALLNQLNSGGNVQFKIKGQDLVGVLNNYTKKISK